MKTNNRNLGSVMKPVQTAKLGAKSGVYMLIVSYLGTMPSSPYLFPYFNLPAIIFDYVFLFVTMIVIALCFFWVPWRRLDSIVTT